MSAADATKLTDLELARITKTIEVSAAFAVVEAEWVAQHLTPDIESIKAAAYRRALEDAADATHANGDSWAITENVPPNVRDVVSNVLWGTADWLRVEARAVAPDPRETKD